MSKIFRKIFSFARFFFNNWIADQKYLNSRLWEVQPHCQLFPGEHIRVLRIPESFLEFV